MFFIICISYFLVIEFHAVQEAYKENPTHVTCVSSEEQRNSIIDLIHLAEMLSQKGTMCTNFSTSALENLSTSVSFFFFFQWRGQQNNVNHLEISNCLFHARMVICTHFLVCLYVVLLNISAVNESRNQSDKE